MLVLDYVKELVQVHVQDALGLAQVVEVVIQAAAVALAHVAEIVNPDVKDALPHVQVLAELLAAVAAPAAVLVAADVLQDVQTPA